MLSKGIDTTIRELVEQLPRGANGAVAPGEFEKLIAPLVEQISSAIVAAASGRAAATAGTASPADSPANPASSPQARLSQFQLSLMRDRTSPMLEQLSNDLVAGDPQYNQRETLLRDRLDLGAIEQRLQQAARSLDVTYDRSDLEGILRNAGYDAAHMGASERYMAAVEKYIGEAENNYRQRSTNVPGQLA